MDWSLFMDTQLGTGECDLFCWMELCFRHTHTHTHTHTHIYIYIDKMKSHIMCYPHATERPMKSFLADGTRCFTNQKVTIWRRQKYNIKSQRQKKKHKH